MAEYTTFTNEGIIILATYFILLIQEKKINNVSFDFTQ